MCISDLADHWAAIVDELRQHHGHIVVDGGGVVRPLARVSHKCAQSKHSRTSDLQKHKDRTLLNIKTDHSTALLFSFFVGGI